MFNRRNALIGWIVWQVVKRVARKKAKAAVPGIDRKTKRPNPALIAGVVAAVGGALWLWRSRASDDDGGDIGTP